MASTFPLTLLVSTSFPPPLLPPPPPPPCAKCSNGSPPKNMLWWEEGMPLERRIWGRKRERLGGIEYILQFPTLPAFVDSLQTPIFLPVRRCEVCNIAGCVQTLLKRRMIKVLSLYAAQSFFYLQESHLTIFSKFWNHRHFPNLLFRVINTFKNNRPSR